MHDEATYTRFAQLGFNVVRLQISWAFLEPKPGVFDLSYLTNYVNKDIQWAKNQGLYIVLDMHQYYWAQRFKLPKSVACGVPDWAVRQYPSSMDGMRQFVSNFWLNDSLQDHLADLWKRIARTYSNDTTIAGYDVLNEPFIYTSVVPYLNATYVNHLYDNLIRSVRSVDSNHIIFLEPANMYASSKAERNIVWSPHFYVLAFNSTYSSELGKKLLSEQLAAMYRKFVVGSGTPMWIGEFSGFMKDGTYRGYLQDSEKLFNQYQLGWAWWGFKAEFGEKVPNVLFSPPLSVSLPLNQPPTIFGSSTEAAACVSLISRGVNPCRILIEYAE